MVARRARAAARSGGCRGARLWQGAREQAEEGRGDGAGPGWALQGAAPGARWYGLTLGDQQEGTYATYSKLR